MTESEVDAIIITLDDNLDDELTYQDLNQGLQLWRKQRRDIKQQNEKEAESKSFIPKITLKIMCCVKLSEPQILNLGCACVKAKDISDVCMGC